MSDPQTPTISNENPYVGPRPFTEDDSDNFYGRQIESQQLTSLVISERVVLFYAQSGAGKTSLLQASVIPRLRSFKRVSVLPIARVSGDLPPGLDGANVGNIYTFNTLFNLRGQDTTAADLGALNLSDGLASLVTPGENEERQRQTYLLILDQFEEIFTTHPDRLEDRAEFFRQLQEALETYPRLSLLISMREDFIAHLDFYVVQIHDRLRTRFRMEPLDFESALPAVREPALQAGRSYDEGVAEGLIDNLRRIQVSRPRNLGLSEDQDAEPETTLGPYVEPVHLQIVCRQLWDSLPADANRIRSEDVQEFGDVDQALTGFYENALREAEEATNLSERNLRTWFTTQVITQARTRGLVYRGETETEGLPNAAVDVLNNAYIIRADIRGGDTWYELTHDRLVEPILTANQAWQVAYHNPVEDGYQAWLDAGRTPDALLKGEALQAAQAFAEANPRDITEDEQAFLTESVRQEAIDIELAEQAARRRRNAITAGVAVMIVLTLLTIWALFSRQRAVAAEEVAVTAQNDAENSASTAVASEGTAISSESTAVVAREIAVTQEAVAVAERAEAERQRDRAEREAQIALSRQLAAQAQNVLNINNPDLALLLAIEGVKATDTLEAVTMLRAILARPDATHMLLTTQQSDVRLVSFSPDETLIAAHMRGGAIQVWDALTGEVLDVFTGHEGVAYNMAWHPDGDRLVTVGSDQTARIWNPVKSEVLVELQGHEGGIYQAAWSPSGERIATASDDGTVRVWDSETGEELVQFIGHTGSFVWRVSWSQDGASILTASGDGTARIWDVESGEEQIGFSGHQGWVTSSVWNNTEDKVVTAGFDSAAYIWDVATGEQLAALTGHTSPIQQVAWNKDSSQVLTLSNDGTGRVWDAETGAQLLLLEGHTDRITSGDWSADETQIVTGSRDKTVRVWDAITGEEKFMLAGHTGFVQSVTWGQDGKTILSASNDQTVRVWQLDLATTPKGELPVYVGHTSGVEDIVLSATGSQIVTSGDDSTARVWDVDTNSQQLALQGHEGIIFHAYWNEDNSRILTSSDDGTARVWDAETGQESFVLSDHSGFVNIATWNQDGRHVLSAGSDGLIQIWDTNTGELISTLEGHEGDIFRAAWNSVSGLETSDGQQSEARGAQILSASSDGTARVWDVQSGENLLVLEGHSDVVWNALWNADESRIVTISNDGTARIWDAETGDELFVLDKHGAPIYVVKWQNETNQILTTSADNIIRVWDAETGDEVVSLEGHADIVSDAEFNATGDQIVSSSYDGTARLWDVATGQTLSVFAGHQGGIWQVEWNADESRIFTAGADGDLRQFHVQTAALLDDACRNAFRNMSLSEWRQYIPDQDYRPTCENLPLETITE
ncbi:MAG: WD40 repeat domain-containing protein [Chloroflexota bacterium]